MTEQSIAIPSFEEYLAGMTAPSHVLIGMAERVRKAWEKDSSSVSEADINFATDLREKHAIHWRMKAGRSTEADLTEEQAKAMVKAWHQLAEIYEEEVRQVGEHTGEVRGIDAVLPQIRHKEH